MIQVIAFNRQSQAQVSANLSATQDAARAALDLSATYPFVRVLNQSGDVVFSQRSGVSKERLVHAIDTKARVTFRGR